MLKNTKLLNFHVKRIHQENGAPKNHKCNLCESTFSCTNHLNTHITTVHEKSKIFKCDFCDKSYGQKSHLNVHIKTIHQKRIFKCDLCLQEFGYGNSLKLHIDKVHKGVKNYKCKYFICKLHT